jgi:hypothetical protein
MLALPSQTHDLLWATIISSGLVFVGVLITAVLAWSNHRTGRGIDATTRSTNRQVTPDNGQRLGPLLEQVSKTTDAIDGRVHDNSKRTDRLEAAMDRVETTVDSSRSLGVENRATILRVETKLDGHIEDTAGLVERAKRDWGPDGRKENT